MFFTYIGFDAVSTAAEECKNPQRDMPFGIMATLIICTILYGSVALVLTGIANWKTLDPDSPVAVALKNLGYNRLRLIVSAGALTGMISSLLVGQYGQARIWFAMSRDGLLPKMFSAWCTRCYRTPYISTWIAGFFVGVPAGLWDIDTFAELIEYRHAVRVHRRVGGRDRAAEETAGPSAHLPRAVGAAGADPVDRVLPGSDDGPAAADVDPVFRVAGDRVGGVFHVRAEADGDGLSPRTPNRNRTHSPPNNPSDATSLKVILPIRFRFLIPYFTGMINRRGAP